MVKWAGRLGTRVSERDQHCEEAILGWEEEVVWSGVWGAAVDSGCRFLEVARTIV